MNFYLPEIPIEWGCMVTGFLAYSADPQNLGEDMLEIQLPNGIDIYAGWSRETAPEGCYEIQVVRGMEPLTGPCRFSTVAATLEAVVGITYAMLKLR